MLADMTTVNIPGVELVRAGTWESARGKVTITAADLAAMVEASRDPQVDAAPVKLGHIDPRFDGEPALGWVRNLRLSADGNTLIGDLTEVPSSLADVIATAYPRRSVEVAWGLPDGDGRKRGAVLTGLALLGVTPPAVKGLADVYRAAASGTEVTVARLGDTANVPHDSDDATQDQSKTRTQEDRMDPNANTDQVDDKVDDKVDDTTSATDTPDDATDAPEKVAASAPQTVTLSAGQYQEFLDMQARLSAVEVERANERRDRIVDAALSEGKITPAERDAYRALLDSDENAGTALLSSLAPGKYPTAALGSAGAPTTTPTDDAWAAFEASLTGKRATDA